MKALLTLTLGLLLLAPSASPTGEGAQTRWRTYRGAWFEIKYPPGFRVRPSLTSGSAQGYDSAFFSSPDGSVEFYIFSPQWNGEPADIEVNPATEVSVSQNMERSGSRTVRRVTIRARDNSSLRSFEDVEDHQLNTRRVLGIKYRDQAAYNRYRQAYLTFKGSLTQFAD